MPTNQAIVELGSHTGLSTCWMASTARARVFAIDPWGPPREGSDDDPFGLGAGAFQVFRANIAAEGHQDKVTALRGTSMDLARFWVDPVGLLFIDAVHEEWAVRQDYELWSPFIPSGAWIAFHDYAPDPAHPYFGVAQVVAEIASDWEDPEIVGNLWTARRR